MSPGQKIGIWLYKWLPIIFGCHCRSDRSFFFHGVQFPLCARCTGELIGILWAIVAFFFLDIPLRIVFCMMIPMVVDGFVQLLTRYESTNLRRVFTGFLFGWAFWYFLAITLRATWRYGYQLGLRWRA